MTEELTPGAVERLRKLGLEREKHARREGGGHRWNLDDEVNIDDYGLLPESVVIARAVGGTLTECKRLT